MNVAIINYGAGNLKSLRFALERCGILDVLITDEAEAIRSADRVIFPGVGYAAYAMERLKMKGLHQLIPALRQPVLGICLGMQLMCAHTEEGNVDGLGIFAASVRRFAHTLKVPHMGWNRIYYHGSHPQSGQYFYFVHGYYAELCEHTMASCDYGFPFSALLVRDNFWGCQFHPEKSGTTGEYFLKHFLA